MSEISLKIDGKEVKVPAGTTILEAAKKADITIPTLCAWQNINHTPGACRVCVVEVDGMRNLVASCVFPVSDNMVVHTNSARVRNARKMIIELLLANHPTECNFCIRNGNCELQKVAEFANVRRVRFEYPDFTKTEIDDSSPSIVRDNRLKSMIRVRQ